MINHVKKPFFVVIAVLAALVFGSCYSYPINAENYTKNIHYWDESLPREESVELFFGAGLSATSYNGVSVDWGEKALVFLPPGETVFTLDLNKLSTSSGIYNGSSSFVWNFRAGDRFALYGWKRDGKLGLLLWSMDVKKDWDEYDFFPFPESGRTVLE
ncbi:MAG: hypothetical protein LBG26_07775 [Treponema sp.]|jgi:hypothetical protein|nr:hypothetical protein [Treponema sp.]